MDWSTLAVVLSPLKWPSYGELWQCHKIPATSSIMTHLLKRLSTPSLNKKGSSQMNCFASCKNFFFWCHLRSSRRTHVALKLAMSTNHGLSWISISFSSKKASWISFSLHVTSSFTNRERWSTITFTLPFLSLISKSNSWSKRTYLINRGLELGLVNKYFMAEWSV